jgi:hypothetical protein
LEIELRKLLYWKLGSIRTLYILAALREIKGVNFMPTWLVTTSKWGSVLVLIALIITFLKSIIAFIASIMAFIGFLTGVIKILIVVAFIGLFAGVAYMIFRSFKDKRRGND